MKLRGILSYWILAAIVLAGTLIVMSSGLKQSLMGTVDEWVDSYTEAIEEAQSDEDDDQDDNGIIVVDSFTVHINDDIGDYAGVETLRLAEASFVPEIKALAKVVDIKPMLLVQARHNQALAALNVAKVAERTAFQEMKRLRTLAKGTSSIAKKNVNYAEATWKEANAKLQGLNFDLQAIKNETLQSWGEEITTWILSDDSKQWQRLLNHQDSLLLVTLPTDTSLVEDTSFIRIARARNQENSTKAYFISPAFAVDQVTQGETHFFKTTHAKLRVGMYLDAWISQKKELLNGVYIPIESAVWSAGQPWVYIQIDDDLYQRRSIQDGINIKKSVFMAGGFEAGEEVVIRGAQMLLSEEFRWQILDEDDDD